MNKFWSKLGSVYHTLAPYLVPVIVVLCLAGSFGPADTTVIPDGKYTLTSSDTHNIILDAKLHGKWYEVTDTVFKDTGKTWWRTQHSIETVYLPGDTVFVHVADANTTSKFYATNTDTTVEATIYVDHGAEYLFPPVNKMKLFATLDSVKFTTSLTQTSLDETWASHFNYGAGVMVSPDGSGLYGVVNYKNYGVLLGYTGNGILLGAEYKFK